MPEAPAGPADPHPDPHAALHAALADRYEIVDTIGHGGMATVFLARDRTHGGRIAIKALRPELALAAAGPRFQREVEIAATLQHPNILPLLASGNAGGLPYLVMPYVEGESLAHRLAREGRLTVEEAVRLTAEVADGLAHAHAAGFIHRDIKPGNILLSHGHAVIADFGIARALDAGTGDIITDSGIALGTAAYMSPEQAAGERVDGRADLYALGCVLYEMLAGTRPFTGATTQAVMARHALDPVPSLRTVRQGVPAPLEDAIMRALAKAPPDRFSSVTEFRDAILAAATVPITAGGSVVALPPVRRARRGWLVAAGAVVAAAALLLPRALRPAPPLDPSRVMVFPLVLPDGWRGARSAGEDVATLIGSAMDGAGALRWEDGWQQLSAAQRTDIRQVALETALALARRNRCAYAVTGRLVARGDSADVFLELHDVRGDSVLVRSVPAAASAADSWRGGLAAVTSLLPALIRTRIPDVEAAWRARPPQAVAHFLLAEAAFRRVQLPDALTQYRAALAADSGFALAAIRGAQAAAWNHRPGEALAFVQLAMRQPLSPRHLAFARGMAAYVDGAADTAVRWFGEAIALDSGMTAAWAQLGETAVHLLPSRGATDSLALAAFLGARRLDSTTATGQFHLITLLRRAGRLPEAARLATGFLAVAADSQLTGEVRISEACGADGTLAAPLAELAQQQPLSLLIAARDLVGTPATARCARQAFTALLAGDTAATDVADGRRFSALLGLVSAQVAAGQTDSARAAITAFQARWGAGLSLFLLAAPVAPGLAEDARRVAAADSAAGGANYARIPYPVRLWELGIWAAHEGKPAITADLAARLTAAAATGERLDSLLAASLRAHAALARGDSAGARRQLAELVSRPLPVDLLAWHETASLGYDRLVLGRLLLAAGEPEAAFAVLQVLDSGQPIVFPLYQRASLETRLAAATALRETARARVLRSRLERWRSS